MLNQLEQVLSLGNRTYHHIYWTTRFVFFVIFAAIVWNWQCHYCEGPSLPSILLVLYIVVLPLDAVIASNMLQFRKVAGIIVFLLLTLIWEVAIAVAAFDLATSYQRGIGYCHIDAEELVSECTYPEVFNINCRQLDEVEGKNEEFRYGVETGCKEALSQKNPVCIYDEQGSVVAFNTMAPESSRDLRSLVLHCSPTVFDPLWKGLYGKTRAEALIPNKNPAKTPEELSEHTWKFYGPPIGSRK